MTKRILSVLLALCLVVGVVPVFAGAAGETSGTCGDNLTWKLEGNTLTISGAGDMSYCNWNNHGKQIKTVVIGQGVTSIGMYAFSGCSSLTSITIPNSVTMIGSAAFQKCSSLTSITIPDSVMGIGPAAFEGCGNLTSITIPTSVKGIEHGTFYGCSSLTTITIPNSVTSIGMSAFADCRNLTDVYYNGTKDQWAKIDKNRPSVLDGGSLNDNIPLLNATTHCTDGDIKGAGVTTLTFSDVPANAYYADAVTWAIWKGITNGTGNNTFSPNAKIKRQDVVTFLWRAHNKPEPKTTKNPFTDVKESDYFYKAVLWAVENHITTGTGNNTFSPAKVCTRKEVATFLWRDAGSPAPKTAKSPFADVKPSDYYYKAVLWAVENKVTTGSGPNKFDPNGNCTRSQTVTFLYRADLYWVKQ